MWIIKKVVKKIDGRKRLPHLLAQYDKFKPEQSKQKL